MNLEEEVLCGFKVSSERKKVWQTELEMVKLFKNICEANNLKYFASGGTLIGAVRHNGFIPWDDDIDLMMPREDYEKFLDIAQNYLPEKFFVQHYGTEKNYPNGHAQIRNSDTACISNFGYTDLKQGKNCGIFIDIFPYDEVPDNEKKRKKYASKINFLKKLCFFKVYRKNFTGLKGVIKSIISSVYFAFHSLEKTIAKFNLASTKFNGKTNTVALISFVPGYEKNVWDKSLFDNTVLHKFEDIEIAIPEKYDEVLRREFGDYMQLPEDKSAGSMHGTCYFNTEKSYKEFINYDKAAIKVLIEKVCL